MSSAKYFDLIHAPMMTFRANSVSVIKWYVVAFCLNCMAEKHLN